MRNQFITLLSNYSMVADGYSAAADISDISGYSVQCVWTGSPSGILFIQISNDNAKQSSSQQTPTNWTTMYQSIVDITQPNYPANTLVYKDALAAYRFVRVGYGFNTGTGSLTINFSAKGNPP